METCTMRCSSLERVCCWGGLEEGESPYARRQCGANALFLFAIGWVFASCVNYHTPSFLMRGARLGLFHRTFQLRPQGCQLPPIDKYHEVLD
jgi:hypothetical protein